MNHKKTNEYISEQQSNNKLHHYLFLPQRNRLYLGVFDGEDEEADDVVDVDPGEELPPGADGSAQTQVKRHEDLLDHTTMATQNNA